MEENKRAVAKFLLLSALLYAPGTVLFIIARREQRKTVCTLVEQLLFCATDEDELSWSLLAAEILHSAAENRTMQSFLAYENARKVPAGALWLTNIVIQTFLLVTYFAEYAFTLARRPRNSAQTRRL